MLEKPASTDEAGSSQQRNTRVADLYKSFLDNWDKGFIETAEDPEGYWMETAVGQVPTDLRGTLFRWGHRAHCDLLTRCTDETTVVLLLHAETVQAGSRLGQIKLIIRTMQMGSSYR